METLAHQYGYWALLVGNLLEGETIQITGGFLAHRGYLNLHIVWLVGFVGSFLGDQFFFQLGRRYGSRFLRHTDWRHRIERIKRSIYKHQNWLMLGFRFMYGFRIGVPVAMGLSRVRTVKFLLFNAVGSFLWALLFGTLGYWAGHILEAWFDEIKHMEEEIVVGLLAAGVLFYGARRLVRFLRKRMSKGY